MKIRTFCSSSPSGYSSQYQSLVKYLRTYSIHVAGPHVVIFFEMATIMSTEGTITADTNHEVQEGWCPYLRIRQYLESEFFADAEFKRQAQDQKQTFYFVFKASLSMASIPGIFSLWKDTKASCPLHQS